MHTGPLEPILRIQCLASNQWPSNLSRCPSKLLPLPTANSTHTKPCSKLRLKLLHLNQIFRSRASNTSHT